MRISGPDPSIVAGQSEPPAEIAQKARVNSEMIARNLSGYIND
jgi:hypothetical protein